MIQYTPDELSAAHRAISSLRSKSDKASGKLKAESWQYKSMRSNVEACDLAMRLMDGDADTIPHDKLDEARKTLTDALNRSGGVIGKFTEGTPQHTLQKNRIAALKIALALIEGERNNTAQ
ncbi:MAG: hypothetical protein LBH17_00200 [Oscillospiraceae bacterium]|nr:hypothetical protein [Oscillospiraceae bacterium]